MQNLSTITSEELDLSNQNLSYIDIVLLGEGIKGTTTLKSLNLIATTLDDQKFKELMRSLSENKTIEELFVGRNELSTEGLKSLAEWMKKPDCKIIQLSLFENKIDDAGIEILVPAFKVCSSLKKVNLDSNTFTIVGVQKLCQWLKEEDCKLTHLSLVKNSIGENRIYVITEMLKKNKSLLSLNLSYNKVKDIGAIVLAEALVINQSLEALFLGFNNIYKAGGSKIEKALKKTRTKPINVDLRNRFDVLASIRHQKDIMGVLKVAGGIGINYIANAYSFGIAGNWNNIDVCIIVRIFISQKLSLFSTQTMQQLSGGY
jgi:hypothetical protein